MTRPASHIKNTFFLIFFLLLTLDGINCRAQEIQEIDNKDNVVRKDSAGNSLSHQQALELLRTGKYISVPTMNSLMQVEVVIRKPRKEDQGKYQTFTDGKTVISSSGKMGMNLKFNLGDTIPPVMVTNSYGESLTLTHNETQNRNVVLIFIKEDDITWREEIQPYVSLLCNDYPHINFVVCPSVTTNLRLTSFFPSHFLKQNSNVFLAAKEFSSAMVINSFAFYMAVNKSGKVLLWIPPIPSNSVFPLLRKNLSLLKD